MLRKRRAKILALMALLTAPVLVVAGCGSDNSSSPVVDDGPADQAPPSNPTALEVTKSTIDGVTLSWSPSPDVDVVGYDVYKYDPSPYRDNAYVKVNGSATTGTSYRVSGLNPSDNYFFKVRAVDGDGLESTGTFPLRVNGFGGETYLPNMQDGDRKETNGSRSPNGGDDGSEHPRPDDDHDGGLGQ